MLTNDDLIDALLEHLQGRLPRAGSPARPAPRPAGRQFLSEFDVRKRLAPGARELRIPKGAIVSPLALDWLGLKRIPVIEE